MELELGVLDTSATGVASVVVSDVIVSLSVVVDVTYSYAYLTS